MDHKLKQLLEMVDCPCPMIFVEKDSIQHSMDMSDICYIETVNKIVFVYSISETYTSLLTLQEISEQFELYGLVRVNKSTILNIYRICSMRLGKQMKYLITLDSGEKFELNRSYRETFFRYLGTEK